VRSFSVPDVPKLLRELGIKGRRSGDEVRDHCPDPRHQRKPGPGSWHCRVRGQRAGLHNCFACGFGGGPVALVRAVLKIDTEEALAWLRAFIGEEGTALGRPSIWKPQKRSSEVSEGLTLPVEMLPLYGKVSDEVLQARDYLLGRGVTPEEISRHRIGAVPADVRSYAGRVIVPVVVRGDLVDIVARLYIPRPPHIPKALSGKRENGARKELALWGYDYLDPGVDTVYVVEGVWGALAMLRAGVLNVVAACGSAWSAERTELLAPWPRVVLVPDGDAAGSKLETRAASLRFSSELLIVDLPSKAQPDTLDSDNLRLCLARPRKPTPSERVVVRNRPWTGKSL
jgi:DNA primase